MWMWGFLAASAAGLALFFRWLLKWRDPSWDSEEGQAKAFLWSTRGSGGINGGG